MDLIPEFVDRKHGRKRVEYLHPTVEPVLAETYGVMVYQEQVMRIAQVVAGYSLGGADVLRRAMGKKKPEEMAKQRSIFVDGAKAKGIAGDTATQLFDLMEKFAGYGFNKSHSAAYALLAYQTAYFKVHYPAAFMAANLSAVMDDTDKVRELVEDSQALGLRILGPDINRGGYRFEPVDARTIRYGLGAVKGTGRSAIEHMVSVRAGGGPFAGLFDFCARMDKQFVNRRVAEALVRAGAFDAIDADRARLAASVGRALEAAERAAAHVGQANLFGGGETAAPADEYVACKPWSERERLANEKLALGFYFSGHLFEQYDAEARRLAPTRLADLRGGPGTRNEAVRVAGIIVSARTQNSRRGRMCVIVLDDRSAQLELTVYAELYDRKRALLREDTLVFVLGKLRYDEFRERLTVNVDDVMDLAEARARAAARLRIEVDGVSDAACLRNALAPFRVGNGNLASGCRVVVNYRNGIGSADVVLSEDWRVRPDEALVEELRRQPKVRAAGFSYG
jgi:DNA polymerase-3 subunit alpha